MLVIHDMLRKIQQTQDRKHKTKNPRISPRVFFWYTPEQVRGQQV